MFFQIRESNFYIHAIMLFPFTGPFLDAIMRGVYIHIFMLTTVKTIAFKRNLSGRRRIYEYAPPLIALGMAPGA